MIAVRHRAALDALHRFPDQNHSIPIIVRSFDGIAPPNLMA